MNFIQKIMNVLTKKITFGKKSDSEKDDFIALWEQVFKEKSDVFCGLFNGMYELSQGRMKRKKSVLNEWYGRVKNRLDADALEAADEKIKPLIAEELPDETKQIAGKILKAAELAGIRREANAELILDEKNFEDYGNFDGEDFSPGDSISILAAAWYKNDVLLEKGFAKKK